MTAGVFNLLHDVSPLILLILFALYFTAFLIHNIRIRMTGISFLQVAPAKCTCMPSSRRQQLIQRER